MRNARRIVTAVVMIGVLVAGSMFLWSVLHRPDRTPRCVVTAPGVASGAAEEFTLTPEQADNAATIAGVGIKLGVPDHAVTIALATALQESGLRDLPGGDRDSAGLFQQRPSQGWGTRAEVLDPVYASGAFYRRLLAQPGWEDLDVTTAAQLVQHSAAPLAYAQWEAEARATAAALTGESADALTCQNLVVAPSGTSLVATAAAELGTTVLSGHHSAARGWSIGTWLVAHGARLGIDQVTFDGHTWFAGSGSWSVTGPADGVLSLHQVTSSA